VEQCCLGQLRFVERAATSAPHRLAWLMSGPFAGGYTPTINDYYDREDRTRSTRSPTADSLRELSISSWSQVRVQILGCLAASCGWPLAGGSISGRALAPRCCCYSPWADPSGQLTLFGATAEAQSRTAAGNYALGASLHRSVALVAGQALFRPAHLELTALLTLDLQPGRLGIAVVNGLSERWKAEGDGG